jgi:hypothetical protein
MKFGTIGAGAVALVFGREALAKGVEVVSLATGGRLRQAGGPLAGRDLVEFGSH